jgi:hypothetical protein
VAFHLLARLKQEGATIVPACFGTFASCWEKYVGGYTACPDQHRMDISPLIMRTEASFVASAWFASV